MNKIKIICICIISFVLFLAITEVHQSKQNIMASWFDSIGILYTYKDNIVTHNRNIMFIYGKNVKEAKFLIGEFKLYIDRTVTLKEYYDYQRRNKL